VSALTSALSDIGYCSGVVTCFSPKGQAD